MSTWVLYGKRTELAVRTLRGSYLPALEQSLLDQEEKTRIVDRIDELAADLERGKHENWQAAAVMQRLQRLPVLQWGELEAVERFLRKSDVANRAASLQQLSRLRRAVELGKATSLDFEETLKPVMEADDQAPNGRRMMQPLTSEAVAQVVRIAEQIADRHEIAEKTYQVDLDTLLRREIEAGLLDGAY